MSEAIKHDQDKPELHYISRELLEEVAKVRSFGAKKYSPNGWKDGFKYSRSISAVLRHVEAFNSGEDLDPESGLLHLAHAVCCLEHLIWDLKYHPELDDRYKQVKDTSKRLTEGAWISPKRRCRCLEDHCNHSSQKPKIPLEQESNKRKLVLHLVTNDLPEPSKDMLCDLMALWINVSNMDYKTLEEEREIIKNADIEINKIRSKYKYQYGISAVRMKDMYGTIEFRVYKINYESLYIDKELWLDLCKLNEDFNKYNRPLGDWEQQAENEFKDILKKHNCELNLQLDLSLSDDDLFVYLLDNKHVTLLLKEDTDLNN